MRAAGRNEVGLEADRVEDRVGREALRRHPARPAVAAWIAASAGADLGGEGAGPRRPGAAAPSTPGESKIFHREEAGLVVAASTRGAAPGAAAPAASSHRRS